MDVGERDWGMIKQYVDLLTGCKIKLSCARERLIIDVHCFYNKKRRCLKMAKAGHERQRLFP